MRLTKNKLEMIKVRIVQATIGYYEVEVKRAWYLPWATVYDGCLPWRGSAKQAQELKVKLLLRYS